MASIQDAKILATRIRELELWIERHERDRKLATDIAASAARHAEYNEAIRVRNEARNEIRAGRDRLAGLWEAAAALTIRNRVEAELERIRAAE